MKVSPEVTIAVILVGTWLFFKYLKLFGGTYQKSGPRQGPEWDGPYQDPDTGEWYDHDGTPIGAIDDVC